VEEKEGETVHGVRVNTFKAENVRGMNVRADCVRVVKNYI